MPVQVQSAKKEAVIQPGKDVNDVFVVKMVLDASSR